MLPSPNKLEMDLCCMDREAEIRQMLLAKELPGLRKNKFLFIRRPMLKVGGLLITLGRKIETHFLAESSQRSLDIVTH